MEVVMNIDTSDTHKCGEILLNDDNGNYVTVVPIGGDEDTPNYELAHKISVVDDLYYALQIMIECVDRGFALNPISTQVVNARLALENASGNAA